MNLAKPPSDGLDQSASEGSSIRERAIGLVASYFESGRFQNELAELVTYKTESQKAERIDELDRYLREAIQPRLEQIGFTCQCHDNPVPGAGPILIAERIEAPDLPTILTYGHGDVVRGQADAWREGLRPFELIEDGDRLYGRGSADSKAQHLINIAALENVLQTRG